MKVLVAILAISTSIAAGSAVYLSVSRTKPTAVPAAAPQPVAVVADASAGTRRAPTERAELVGRLSAASEVDVQAIAGGSVLHARVDPGDLVEKGQTLIELENPALEEPVRRAETALELAKSELEAQQQRRLNAEQRREGLLGASLAGRGAGGGSLRMARNDEQQARTRVAEAEAALRRARLALGESQIVAPLTGYVAERRVTVGERVEPGMTVLRIVDVSTLKIELDAAEGNALQTVPASAREARITFDAIPDRQFVGRVVRSFGGNSLLGHPNAVSIEVANPERVLKPGMSGHVRLVSGSSGEPSLASLSGRYRPLARQSRGTADGSSDADLLREMLVSMKSLAITLAVAADSQTKELTRKQEAAKVTVEATTQYFGLLERQVSDLRPDNASHHAVSLEKAADEIDNLPILHVDEELLAFGADVTQGLRAMAERRRSISRSRSYTDVTVTEEAQVENSAVRTQGMQKIAVGLANMRRKMTKKYNLEFLANAANIHTASVSKRHPARR
jgi:membrane fusion protein, multidrug efflux system